MPAPSRSTCHGHQHVPGRSGEQQKQADMGPGRTHTHLSWVKPTTHLEAPEQPIPAWSVLRHILSHPPASASSPKTMGSVAILQELVASWEAQRAGTPLDTKEHPWTDSLSPASRQSAPISPPLPRETPGQAEPAWSHHCASHPQPVHHDCTGWRRLLSPVSLC